MVLVCHRAKSRVSVLVGSLFSGVDLLRVLRPEAVSSFLGSSVRSDCTVIHFSPDSGIENQFVSALIGLFLGFLHLCIAVCWIYFFTHSGENE